MAITEKELNAATFLAVAALAKRLTGADICVTIKSEDGHIRSLVGNNDQVTWFENGSRGSVSPEVIQAAREMLPFGAEQVSDVPQQPPLRSHPLPER